MFTVSPLFMALKSVVNMRAGNPISKPETVIEYNKYMNTVDQFDQYLARYTFSYKTITWCKKIFVRPSS